MDAVILTAKEISAFQAHKMSDVLNHVSGVTATDSSVSIHGSYKVKVFVDGRPMNDPTSSFGAIEWGLVNPDEVEKIEIHLGKGAVKYGQDASGGVILVTTMKNKAVTGNVKLYGGNQGIGYGAVNLQAARKDVNAGVSGSYEISDGYMINNDKRRWRAGLRLGYEPAKDAGVLLTSDYLDDERGVAGYPDFPTPLAHKTSNLSITSFRANYHALSSNTAYVSSRNRNTDISKNLDRSISVTELSENLSGAYQSAGWGSTSYGAGYQQNRASGSFDAQQEHTWSVFALQTLPKGKVPLQFSLGLRANFNSAFDNALNPEVKATYARPSWQLTAAYSGSNNTPSFYQRYNETSSTRPNPDLQMETAQNYSLSLSNTWSSSVSTGVALFYNRLNNRITYVLGNNGVGQYLNFGEVTYVGGDVSLTWKMTEQVTFKSSYTYLEAKDQQSGYWLPGKPQHTGNLSIQYRPTESFSINATEEYESLSYRDTKNTVVLPGYWLADLKAEYSWRQVSVFADISNLFNKEYLYGDGLLAPPRTWFVGFNYRL